MLIARALGRRRESVIIGRIWRTRIDARRSDEYRAFVESTSFPMFQAHEGFPWGNRRRAR